MERTIWCGMAYCRKSARRSRSVFLSPWSVSIRMKARRSLPLSALHASQPSSQLNEYIYIYIYAYCLLPCKYFMISTPHSGRLALPYPGISSKTTFDSPPFVPPIPKAFISLVRPGRDDVQQISFSMIAFSNELLPTFERPRNATSGSRDDIGVVRNLLADHSLMGEWCDGAKNLSA